MKTHQIFRLATLPAAIALMTACGGGGDGGGGGGGNSPTTVSGSVTKGIVKNGVVTMTQAGSTASIGTGRTNADGRYTLTYSGYSGGLVQLCVTADAQTRVVCDANDGPDCGPAPAGAAADTNGNGTFDLGEELPAPSDFRMCTLLPEPPANGVSAPITPFTNVVVQRAAQTTEATATAAERRAALRAAASEVNQLLGGIDVLRLDPVDLSDEDAVADASPEALVYAALIAATLGTTVNGLGDGEALDLQAVIERIGEQTEGGAISLDDFQDLLAEAQQQLFSQGLSDDSGVIEGLEDQAEQAANEGETTFDPDPLPNANDTGIARARGLIQELRNTFVSLDQYEEPLEAFGVDLDSAAAVIEANETTGQQLADVFAGATEFFSNDPACEDENCTITTDGITTTFATSGSTLTGTIAGTSTSNGAVVDIQVTGPANGGSGATSLVLDVVRATVSNSTARLRITEGDVAVTLSAPFDPDAEEFDEQSFQNGSFDLVGSVEALSGGNATASATGTIRFDAVRASQCTLPPSDPDDVGDARVNLSSATVKGAVAAGTESADLEVSVTLANATSFCPDVELGPQNVPAATATVTANLNLDGVPDARVVITAGIDGLFERTGEPDEEDDIGAGLLANGSVTLTQNNAQVFRVVAASTRPTPTAFYEVVTSNITSASNVAITVVTDRDPASRDDEGDIGVIKVDGVRVGVIRQSSNGLVIARYDDGTFESLF